MLYDNPASRLQAVLEQGLAVPHDQSCRRAWEEILGVQGSDTSELFAKLGKVMELPRQTHLLLEMHFPHQADNSHLWRDPVELAFLNQQLGGAWVTFIKHINPYCVPQIGLIAELLHSKIAAKTLKEEELTKILGDVKALIDEVEASSISQHLKNYLLQELSQLAQSVREYKLSGATPILKQAESMVGHALLDREYSNFLTNHELGKRLLDNLNAMAAVITIAASLPQLAQGFVALIPK